MGNDHEISTEMSVYEYIATVDGIAAKYFDKSGNYQPHWGYLGTVAYFYNLFFDDRDADNDEINLEKINDALKNADFVNRFNNCINGTEDYGAFNFYRAYSDAMKIVDNKKSAGGIIRSAVDYVTERIGDLFNNMMTEDNIAKLSEMAKLVSDGSVSGSLLADAFVEKFRENNLNGDSSDKEEKIIPFRKK